MIADLRGTWSLFELATDDVHFVALRVAVDGDAATVQVSCVTDWERTTEADTLTFADPATVAALAAIVTAVRQHGSRVRHEQRVQELTGDHAAS